jgi:hypothetical protein
VFNSIRNRLSSDLFLKTEAPRFISRTQLAKTSNLRKTGA